MNSCVLLDLYLTESTPPSPRHCDLFGRHKVLAIQDYRIPSGLPGGRVTRVMTPVSRHSLHDNGPVSGPIRGSIKMSEDTSGLEGKDIGG